MPNRNQFNSQEAANIQLGQTGSFLAKTGNNVPVRGQVIIAITFITASVFESGSTGLVPETTYRYPSSTEGATLIVSSSVETDGITFPAGMTIYGRWTSFELNSGSCIAYIDEGGKYS